MRLCWGFSRFFLRALRSVGERDFASDWRLFLFSFFPGERPMSFGIYAVGYLILIIGVAYLAHVMHVPEAYIIGITIILFGLGIVTGVQSTRHKDPS